MRDLLFSTSNIFVVFFFKENNVVRAKDLNLSSSRRSMFQCRLVVNVHAVNRVAVVDLLAHAHGIRDQQTIRRPVAPHT
jgi:hypothetical protein